MLPLFRGIYAHPVSSFQGTDKVVKRGAFHFISFHWATMSPVRSVTAPNTYLTSHVLRCNLWLLPWFLFSVDHARTL